MVMPLKILFTVGLLFAAFSPAQEIGKLDLVGVSNRIVPDLTEKMHDMRYGSGQAVKEECSGLARVD